MASGVECEVRHVDQATDCGADVVWQYGMGPAKRAFDSHPSAVRIVGDKGYFAEYAKGDRYFRVSVNAQQPDAHLRLREHPADRWQALGINVEPVKGRGEYILLCGVGPKQSQIIQGIPYGSWERRQYDRLRAMTGRPVLVREKPKNPPIHGLPRSTHDKASDAIRGAFAVVCMTGNIGVDAILQGVPVFADAGPGRVYYPQGIDDLEGVQPLTAEQRLAALSDITYWQWTEAEISSGALWQNLRAEGLL